MGTYDHMIKKKFGMTFVEVIVAMAIFAILVVGIFPAFMLGIKLNAVSKISVETASVAQTTMEEIYNYSVNNTLANTIVALSSTYSNPSPGGSDTTLTKSTFDYTIIIVFTTNSPQSGMTKTKITVTKLDNPFGALPAQAETILLFK